MLTDLQRIELAFPAEAMLHVVDHGADPKDPTVQRARRLLVGTVDKAFAGLAGRDLRKLRTRLDRTMRAFLAPIVAIGGRVDVVGVIAWRVLAAVLEADILVLPEAHPSPMLLRRCGRRWSGPLAIPSSSAGSRWSGPRRCAGFRRPGSTGP